jgi:hydrogenase maturation protease
MDLSHVEEIADAVLYEGYILYPYRPSSVKNQQRWNFGALCPESYSLAQHGTESWTMQTECLIQQTQRANLELKLRFLHLLTREVGRRIADCQLPIGECGHFQAGIGDSHFALVPALEVNGQLFQAWQEAVEREVCVAGFNVGSAITESRSQKFTFPSSEQVEPLRDEYSSELLGVIVRKQQAIEGAIEVRIAECGVRIDEAPEASANPPSAIRNPQSEGLSKVSVRILNRTPFEEAYDKSRDEALMRSFVSTHTILGVHDGEFVSLLDPPEVVRQVAQECNNIGTYPVLAGEEGTRDCMLSSPIILYDYPQIAPESAGNLFDGTEIDEILTLRIMTLTEEEKREMRGADDRARQILERTETLPMEQLMKMHGAMKGVKR